MTEKKRKEEVEQWLAEVMGIRRVADVSVEPETRLSMWSIRRVHANFDGRGSTLHLCGWAQYEGRVCSPIQLMDIGSMMCVTRSGRVYQLEGSPGHHPDAEHVWIWWIEHNGSPQWEDVTCNFFKEGAE